jgi:hypothetical protein
VGLQAGGRISTRERRLAEALARELGFVFDDAHVIGEGTNVLLRLYLNSSPAKTLALR